MLGRIAGKGIFIVLVLPLLLTGCWDMKTIQDVNYMTAIGFDYQDGQYIVYGQMLSFANVAKQEGQSTQAPKIWVGKGAGETVSAAYNNLYRTAQQRVFWGHVGAYLFSQAAIEKAGLRFTDGSIRFNETRYTQWIYTTNEPILDLLNVIPFFDVSPMNSILMQPEENYRQHSMVAPLRLYKVSSQLREPGNTVNIPVLGVDRTTWYENKKEDPKLRVEGIVALTKMPHFAVLSFDRLVGLRWMSNETVRTTLPIHQNGKAVGVIRIEKPRASVKPRITENQVYFDVQLKGKAIVAEVLKYVPEPELTKLIEEEIKKNIRYTFSEGRKVDADVYSFEHVLYHDRFPDWARLTNKGAKALTDFELGDIQVNVHIVHSGMLRLKRNESQY
ncbi:Ger(x)C family spore germination protein [Paenibacillus oryzisoli]|uniref:Ger(x)C family spore germination protein n=1 Tax=Paenibacillus oryzisoli TaxID=1850517 RepID=UPI003D2ADB68